MYIKKYILNITTHKSAEAGLIRRMRCADGVDFYSGMNVTTSWIKPFDRKLFLYCSNRTHFIRWRITSSHATHSFVYQRLRQLKSFSMATNAGWCHEWCLSDNLQWHAVQPVTRLHFNLSLYYSDYGTSLLSTINSTTSHKLTSLLPIFQPEHHIESERWNDFHEKYGPDLLRNSPIQQPPSYLRQQGRFLMSLITLCCVRQSMTSDPPFRWRSSKSRHSRTRHIQASNHRQSSSRHMQAWSSTAASSTATGSSKHESRILL
jgi:hypothetical protein